MDMIELVKQKLRRRAIVFEIGGFRPPADLDVSWFGRVLLGAKDERWPETHGRLMHPLCQINLTMLPFRPPQLEDAEFLTLFIGPDELPVGAENGTNWCLRTYSSINDLVPLVSRDSGSHIGSFPMRPQVIEEDFPMWDDVAVELPEEIADSYYDHFSNARGLKLGGWPSLIQSEIYWSPGNRHAAAPEYVFQIDSTEKGNWMWGDNGTGYFGRGTNPGFENEWAVKWQCY